MGLIHGVLAVTSASDAALKEPDKVDRVREIVRARIETRYCDKRGKDLPLDYEVIDAEHSVLLPGFVGELNWPALRRVSTLRAGFWYLKADPPREGSYGVVLLLDPCEIKFITAVNELIGTMDFDVLTDSDLLDLAYMVHGFDDLTRAIGPYFLLSSRSYQPNPPDEPFYGCTILTRGNTSRLDLTSEGDRQRIALVVEGPVLVRSSTAIEASFVCTVDDLRGALWKEHVVVDRDGSAKVTSTPIGLKVVQGRVLEDK
jgi:hypothetical protein